MANDTIELVKQAELNADKILESARNKAEIILNQSKEESEDFRKSILKEANAKSSLKIGMAKNQAKRDKKSFLKSVEEEAEKIKSFKEENKKDLIKAIIEEVM